MAHSLDSFARKALWCLPVWSLLLFLVTLTHQPDPQTAFADFAAYITTPQFLVSHLVGSIAGAAIGSIGAVALMLYLQDSKVAGRAATGMLTMVAGNTLTTAVFGTAAFAQPAMGRMFLEGAANAQEFYNQTYAAPLFLTVIIGLLLMIIGGILLGMAAAAYRPLPGWAGWVFAISVFGFVLSGFIFPLAQSLFSALLTLAGAAIAWSASREAARRHSPAGSPVDL